LQQQPLKQPLRPAEIPLKLPVYLTFGVQQPEMERARIRRQPVYEQVPCDEPCDNYQHGLPRVPCTTPVPAGPPPVQIHPGAAPPAAFPGTASPPVPIADPTEQARRLPLVPVQPTAYLPPEPAAILPWQPLR
jgi:hypothetical protein